MNEHVKASAPKEGGLTHRMAARVELFSVWCGVAYLFLLFFGWFYVAGFFPMHRPAANAHEIASIFHADNLRIRIGMVIVMWGAVCMIPFGASIANHVARFEGGRRTLTYAFVMAAFANAMLSFYPPLWLIIASFRSIVRSDELLYLVNDVAWLQFLGGLSLIMPMFIVVAIMAICDTRPQPVFPRWIGFFNILVFVGVIPGQLLFFFYDGPFAWNGLIGIWIPLIFFGLWFLTIFHYLRRAAMLGLEQVTTPEAPFDGASAGSARIAGM